MKLTTQRRLAAAALKCGEHRIWFDPRRLQEIKDAITNQDIRSLIHDLAIQKHAIDAHSGFRRRKMLTQKRKGRLRGMGNRKGKKTARTDRKRDWIRRVRAQRKFLQNLKKTKRLDGKHFVDLYTKSSGGFFRSTKHIERYIEEHKLLYHETKKDHSSPQKTASR